MFIDQFLVMISKRLAIWRKCVQNKSHQTLWTMSTLSDWSPNICVLSYSQQFWWWYSMITIYDWTGIMWKCSESSRNWSHSLFSWALLISNVDPYRLYDDILYSFRMRRCWNYSVDCTRQSDHHRGDCNMNMNAFKCKIQNDSVCVVTDQVVKPARSGEHVLDSHTWYAIIFQLFWVLYFAIIWICIASELESCLNAHWSSFSSEIDDEWWPHWTCQVILCVRDSADVVGWFSLCDICVNVQYDWALSRSLDPPSFCIFDTEICVEMVDGRWVITAIHLSFLIFGISGWCLLSIIFFTNDAVSHEQVGSDIAATM